MRTWPSSANRAPRWSRALYEGVHHRRHRVRRLPSCRVSARAESRSGSAFPARKRLENPYGGSKIASEFLAVQFGSSYGLPVVRVRPFQHTGPRQSPAYVCSSLARQVAEIEAGSRPPILEVGNPQIARDFSDARDI